MKKKFSTAIDEFAQSDGFFRRLIDSLDGYALFTIDTKGIIKTWNAGSRKILGYSRKEIIGKNYRIFFTKEDLAKGIPQAELNNTLTKHRLINEGWRIKKGGKLLWATGFAFPLRNKKKELIGFTKIMRDRSDRKHLEDNQNLITQQKDVFIGIASHELRTPVTSLRLFSDILINQATHDKKDDVLNSAKIIKIQIDKLMRLVDDLLDVSKIQAEKLELNYKVFNLNQLIESVIAEARHITPTHSLVYTSGGEHKIKADKERIYQVLMNLISNAAKYSPRAKTITIKVLKKNKKIEIAVQDFGIGIPKYEQPHIFDRFFRTTDAKDKNISGFGLGLYISAEIIRRHGGELRVKSTLGKGSTFYFTLPRISLH